MPGLSWFHFSSAGARAVADEDAGDRDLAADRARTHREQRVAARRGVVDDEHRRAGVLRVERLDAELAGAAQNQCGLAGECACREGVTAGSITRSHDIGRRVRVRAEDLSQRDRCAERGRLVREAWSG